MFRAVGHGFNIHLSPVTTYPVSAFCILFSVTSFTSVTRFLFSVHHLPLLFLNPLIRFRVPFVAFRYPPLPDFRFPLDDCRYSSHPCYAIFVFLLSISAFRLSLSVTTPLTKFSFSVGYFPLLPRSSNIRFPLVAFCFPFIAFRRHHLHPIFVFC